MCKAIQKCLDIRRTYKIFDDTNDLSDIHKLRIKKDDSLKEPILDYNLVAELPLPPNFDDDLIIYDGFNSTSRQDYKG